MYDIIKVLHCVILIDHTKTLHKMLSHLADDENFNHIMNWDHQGSVSDAEPQTCLYSSSPGRLSNKDMSVQQCQRKCLVVALG